ncbi:hypothetical protein EVAR_86406_1 [Eumeta japonica]|uniref:Uncharacterized protein n=1 Tax=Eumeta variegata TaxID=151549 RepID=A0A4C1WBF7_EUMVA|nr:hypothetical protein EVAR_86406_1 [Eumeta japonica]
MHSHYEPSVLTPGHYLSDLIRSGVRRHQLLPPIGDQRRASPIVGDLVTSSHLDPPAKRCWVFFCTLYRIYYRNALENWNFVPVAGFCHRAAR